MKYREFNGFDVKTSVLGFGAMRLPIVDGDYSKVDEPSALEMLRHAIDNGVNYVDTAYPYHGGNSETFIGKVLKDGYRKKVYLTTKLPVSSLKEKGDMERIFNDQMKKLDVDYLDFYLLHALNRNSWKICKENGTLEFIDNLKKSGKVKRLGFSFHDSPEIFKEIADAYSWDMVQLQFNYADTKVQAGMESFDYAREKDFNIVIMEPLKGGALANNITDELREYFEREGPERSPVEWAFRWLYNFPEVKLILSGMSTMEQVKDNLRIFSAAEPKCMTDKESKVMEGAIKIMENSTAVPCTDCKYCMPCPHGVRIPLMFSLYNKYTGFKNNSDIVKTYKGWRERKENKFTADLCVRCGVCLAKCPQKIQIPDRLAELDAILYNKQQITEKPKDD
ncbi:MAG: aldo/keto reductase [Clostridiales bacterium]|nr:aldo/keto reductase [Clostridiales bacterium]